MRFSLSALAALVVLFAFLCYAVARFEDTLAQALPFLEYAFTFLAVGFAVGWQGPAKYFARGYVLLAVFIACNASLGLHFWLNLLYELVTAQPPPVSAGFEVTFSEETGAYERFFPVCYSALSIVYCVVAGCLAQTLYCLSRSRKQV